MAFFDILGTLAQLKVNPESTITEFAVYPGAAIVLEELERKGVCLGIIADCVCVSPADLQAALMRSDISHMIDPALIFIGFYTSPRLFKQALDRARSRRLTDSPLLFVSSSLEARVCARSLSFRTAPHPSLAEAVLLDNSPLQYVQVNHTAPELSNRNEQTILSKGVPIHISHNHAADYRSTIEIMPIKEIFRLEAAGADVVRLGSADLPQTSTVFLFTESHMAMQKDQSIARTGAHILKHTVKGTLVALSAEHSTIAAISDEAPWSHAKKALPTVTLGWDQLAGDNALSIPPCRFLTDKERHFFNQHIRSTEINCDVLRYSGSSSCEHDLEIVSRHICHPHNSRAVRMLFDQLETIGQGALKVGLDPFKHAERELFNVVATLPSTDEQLAGIVIISAHLDSTAEKSQGYRPCLDRAPGADDDASGIAGVLATARAFVQLHMDGIPHREVRFVLFNAEEVGIVGSAEYAAACAAHAEPILAVFHIDMIGYNAIPPARFEVHAGLAVTGRAGEVERQLRSKQLAQLVECLRPQVSPTLPDAELFVDNADGAIEHSDHTRFHSAGYAACVVSEDCFLGKGGVDANPDYHKTTDSRVDSEYAAAIARCVAAAAWVVATP